ncbi:hypothetical protein ACRALDRAFT_1067221 [Sodiomyces alcalophilus JCM 7366]|uniref:uncharacterized protein n=1 Tax=Sodiomyces alcalophilus JCM 7366 TaxID=591952 RepID=UPI0039B3F216
MPLQLSLNGQTRIIQALPLTPKDFASFGYVHENPQPDVHPSVEPVPDTLSPSAIRSDQVTAFKFLYPSIPLNLYQQAPSQKPGETSLGVFVVATRPQDVRDGHYSVRLLERHPFTTQTFSPMITPPGCSYLVLVAPSLPPPEERKDWGFPLKPDAQGHGTLQGSGLPDLSQLRAFVATGQQAITYGAGTWHAPMVVLGPRGATMQFMASQFSNGVREEDSQEVVFGGGEDEGKGWIKVQLPE